MRTPEPCMCGAPDCAMCFPLTWREAKDEAEQDSVTVNDCPFCASDNVEIDEIRPEVYAVVCQECETVGPASYKSTLDAVEKWNSRHDAA